MNSNHRNDSFIPVFFCFLAANFDVMRKTLLFFLCVFGLTSCVDMLWDSLGKMRSQVLGPGSLGRTGETDAIEPDVPSGCDTLLLLCGVQVPPGYDWQKDTAIGLAQGKVVLYRDMKQVLAFPTGYYENVSTDPDTHHLIDGHLYTEFSSSSRTVIKKDGKMLFEYEGREYLDGLLVRDGDVYTLGSRRSGYGFTCRRNGEIILDSPGGFVFGSFRESTYPETGGLYLDEGKICFSYRDGRTGSTACVFREGLQSMVNAGDGVRLEDVRINNGEITGVGINSAGKACVMRKGRVSVLDSDFLWDSCRLVFVGADVFISGCASDSSGIRRRTVIVDAGDGSVKEDEEGEKRVLCDGGKFWLEPMEYAGYYCFSKSCLCSFGDDWYKALTPKNGCCPVLVKNGITQEIEMNGYLTGVEVAVIPTT